MYLTFFLFSLGQLGRISFLGQQINIYLYEIVLASHLLFLLFKYRIQPLQSSLKRLKVIYLFFGFLVLSYILGLVRFNLGENLIGLLYMLRLTSYFVYFVYQLHDLKKEGEHKKIFTYGYFIFVAITIGTSVVQYFLYPNLRNLSYLGWDPHFLRLFGVFFDTSVAGALFGLFFLVILFIKLPTEKKRLMQIGFGLLFSFFMLFTYSRGVYLALGLTLALYFLSLKKIKVFLLLLVLGLSFIIFVPKPFGEGGRLNRVASVGGRLNDYKTAFLLWREHPLLGDGYNRIRYAKRYAHLLDTSGYDVTHAGASFSSSYLIILVAGGIVALVLFLGVLYQLAQLTHLAKYAVIFLSLYSVTDNILLHPFVLFLFLQTIILSTTTLFGRSRL